jgi:ribosomal protein S18 acetylase RimI-like enzyme
MPTPVLRPSTPSDEVFLTALYASTRADELAASGWPEEFQKVFCAQQFAAQTAHYQSYYSAADFSIIVQKGRSLGRLIVLRTSETLRIVDISLLPQARGKGIGSLLMRSLLSEARAAGKSVCLNVEKRNRAQRLYERLGFKMMADDGFSLHMEWRAAQSNF